MVSFVKEQMAHISDSRHFPKKEIMCDVVSALEKPQAVFKGADYILNHLSSARRPDRPRQHAAQVVAGKYLALLTVFLIPMCVIAVYPLIFW